MNACNSHAMRSAFLALTAAINSTYASTTAESHAEGTPKDLSQYSPLPPIRVFRPNPNLEIAFDTRTRNPIYALERIVIENHSRSGRKRLHFYEEKSLPEAFRSRNHHFHLSGYDRGHLAPAADFHDEKELADSYSLTNVSPQHHEMNRKIWATLEQWVRTVARKAQHDSPSAVTYVVTGPLWLPRTMVKDKMFEYQYRGIGYPPSIVSVPTHFFKVVVIVDENVGRDPKRQSICPIRQFACFVVPNEPIKKDKTLQDFVVCWTDLEAVSGLTFFPELLGGRADQWKAIADGLTVQSVPQVLLLSEGAISQHKLTSIDYELRHLCHDGHCTSGRGRT